MAEDIDWYEELFFVFDDDGKSTRTLSSFTETVAPVGNNLIIVLALL